MDFVTQPNFMIIHELNCYLEKERGKERVKKRKERSTVKIEEGRKGCDRDRN